MRDCPIGSVEQMRGKRICIIRVRDGFTLFPDKTCHIYLGRPIFGWLSQAAQAAGCSGRIVDLTKDDEIATSAQMHNAKARFVMTQALPITERGGWL